MIEVEYSNEGNIRIKSDASLSKDAVDELIRLVSAVRQDAVRQDAIRQPKTSEKDIPPYMNRDIIETQRQRLPNKIERVTNSEGTHVGNNKNVVDLSKLDIEKLKATPYDVFRCPDCGQSIIAQVNGITVIRDLDKPGNLAIIENYTVKAELEGFNYETAKKYVVDVGVKLAGDNNTTVTCLRCGHDDKRVEEWVEAFKEPLKFFEYEVPCPICGSETAMIIAENGKEDTFKCENKSCEYTY